MSLFILDTDHISLLQREDARVTTTVAALPPEAVAVTVISYEESMRGWLARVNSAQSDAALSFAYAMLAQTQQFYCSLRLLEFDQTSATTFRVLRKRHPRLGSMDLRIAATALTHNAILVTRNTQDFAPIENLRLENWA